MNMAMTTETRQLLAAQLRAAADALITNPTGENFNLLSRAVAALTSAGASGVPIHLACCAMYDIYARYQEHAAITVSDREAKQIRAAIASVEEELPSLQVQNLKQAIAEVDVNCASVGA